MADQDAAQVPAHTTQQPSASDQSKRRRWSKEETAVLLETLVNYARPFEGRPSRKASGMQMGRSGLTDACRLLISSSSRQVTVVLNANRSNAGKTDFFKADFRAICTKDFWKSINRPEDTTPTVCESRWKFLKKALKKHQGVIHELTGRPGVSYNGETYEQKLDDALARDDPNEYLVTNQAELREKARGIDQFIEEIGQDSFDMLVSLPHGEVATGAHAVSSPEAMVSSSPPAKRAKFSTTSDTIRSRMRGSSNTDDFKNALGHIARTVEAMAQVFITTQKDNEIVLETPARDAAETKESLRQLIIETYRLKELAAETNELLKQLPPLMETLADILRSK